MAFGGHLLDDVEKPVQLRARRVDCEKHRVQAGLFRRERRLDGGFHRPLNGPAVGVLDHVIACRDLDDDPLTAAGLDHFDLVGDAPRKSKNLGLQAQGGNILNRGFVLFGNRRHSRLNTVNSQRIELPRNRHLLLTAEDDCGLLLTIAQCDVVDL